MKHTLTKFFAIAAIVATTFSCHSQKVELTVPESQLRTEIAQMLMVGFRGTISTTISRS